jgi:hypothetical protein
MEMVSELLLETGRAVAAVAGFSLWGVVLALLAG